MRLAIGLLILSCALHASEAPNDSPMTMKAEKADYKDRMITLAGDVEVDHDVGKMCAQHVEIHSAPNEKQPRLSTIRLAERVNIALKDGGQLTCSFADIDYLQMKGVFNGDVVYTETCKGDKQENIPLIVKSRQMTLELGDSARPQISSVNRITADGSVNVNYNYDFIGSGDKGLYIRHDAPEDSQAAGIVSLMMDSGEGRCKVVNRNGDLINASRIDIDTQTKELTFTNAAGTITGSREGQKPDQRIDFSADTLLWSSTKDCITLRKNAVINQAGQGRLTSDGEVRIFQQSLAGKKQLTLLETEGKTVIVFSEPGKNVEHTLTSYGPVTVDHLKLVTIMNSPTGPKGKIQDDEQVAFQDAQGEVHANKAILYYTTAGEKIALSKVRLEGNVRMQDQQPSSGDILHYTIADVVEYTPDSKEMTFTAKNKRRVLFYDKINNVQVSAPALKIKRDEMSKKESIKGLGDVRFSFLDQEYAQLRKRFKLDPTEANQP